jgi:hypothetical protein
MALGPTHIITARRFVVAGMVAALVILAFRGNALGADGAGADTRHETDLPDNGDKEEENKAASEPTDAEMRSMLEERIDFLAEERCKNLDMVRYHGRCMKAEQKLVRVEKELKHVENLLYEATMLYRTDSPEMVAWMFQRSEEFVGEFSADPVVDRQIAEKTLLLLGNIYLAATRLANEMKEGMKEPDKGEEPLTFLDAHAQRERFLVRVHSPVMKLFGKQIDAYVSLYGSRAFQELMTDNDLYDVLNDLS